VTGFLGRDRKADGTSAALDGAIDVLSEGEIARIDALAADRGLPRAAVLVELVRRGLLDAPAPPSMRLADIVRRHVIESFHANQENVSRTARALGISRVSLRRHLQAYGVKQKGSVG
jgi:transcriptional regulator of acetoin/glycerol metabolism